MKCWIQLINCISDLFIYFKDIFNIFVRHWCTVREKKIKNSIKYSEGMLYVPVSDGYGTIIQQKLGVKEK